MWKPGTRVQKVAPYGGGLLLDLGVPVGTCGTVADRQVDAIAAAEGCDFCVLPDGWTFHTNAHSHRWRPLDQNDPATESWAQIKRELGNPQMVKA